MWVPRHLATMPVLIKRYEGLDENGAKNFVEEINVKAAVFNDLSIVYTSEGEKKRLSVKAYIFDDLDKLDPLMMGVCYLNKGDKEYLIHNVVKVDDMNGQVNHYELGLM